MPNKKIISLDELSRFKTNCDSEYQDTLVSGTNIKTINNTTLLSSGNYEFDSALSEISTNAIQNKVVSKEFAEINYELAVIREELFETILTEIDYQENFAISYTIPDTLTDTDGTHRVVFSETQLKTIEFNSVVMNQPVKNGNFANANDWLGFRGTLSISSNVATITANDNSSPSFGIVQTGMGNSIVGHKYLGIATIKHNIDTTKISKIDLYGYGGDFVFSTPPVNTEYTYFGIVECSTALSYLNVRIVYNNASDMQIGTDELEVYSVMLIDLTKMFGAGNEPITIDDTRIQWLLSLGYIEYNTGSLLSTTTTGIQVKDSNDNVLGTISVLETSGKSAGNAHDYIEVVDGNIVEGEQLYNLVLHTLVDSVDLSDLEFTKGSSNRYISNDLQNSSKYYAYNVKPNAVCDKLEIATPDDVRLNTKEKIISINDTGTLVVYISSSYYSSHSAEQFISDYGNTKLNYELATPTIQTIATDLQFDQISSLIEQGGTINALFTNTPPNVKTTFVVKKAVGE